MRALNKKFFFKILMFAFFLTSQSRSQSYEWKEIASFFPNNGFQWSILHVDSTNRLYLFGGFDARCSFSDDEGKTWNMTIDSSIVKEYYGYTIMLDSNGILHEFDINEFGKNAYAIPDIQHWFVEHQSAFKANKNPWIALSKSNKIFLPNVVVLTSVDSGRYWKHNDILNNRPEKYYYLNDSLWIHYLKQQTSSVLIDSYEQILISSKVGVYRSTDEGKYWTSQNTGLKDSSIRMMRMGKGGIIYAISDSGRIFKGSLILNSIVRNDHQASVPEFTLYQNYPNPFNPSTSIDFSVPKKELVSIKVYSVIGTEIVSLANNTFSVGVHTVVWNAQSIPSGLYFYQLKTTSHSETRKMILLK